MKKQKNNSVPLSVSQKNEILRIEELRNLLTSDILTSSDTEEHIKEDMTKRMEKMVESVHTNVICVTSDGRYKTKNPQVTSTTYDGLIEKLYKYYFKPNYPTLESLFETWIDVQKEDPDVMQNTYNNYIYVWNRWLKGSELIQMPIKKIKPAVLLQFYKSTTCGRAISRTTLSNIKGLVNSLYDYAVYKEYIPTNSARGVNTRKLKCKVVDHSTEVYTSEERETLLNYLKDLEEDDIYALAIELHFRLGCRIGELRALQWSDYDEQYSTIRICKQIRLAKKGSTYEHYGRFELVPHTKGGEGGNRTLLVTPKARKVLQRVKAMNLHCEGNFIFSNNGVPLYADTYNEHLKKYDYACGIRYFSSHKIRFWSVSAQVQNGMDATRIQYNAGHSDMNTTFHYMRMLRMTPEEKAIWMMTMDGDNESPEPLPDAGCTPFVPFS